MTDLKGFGGGEAENETSLGFLWVTDVPYVYIFREHRPIKVAFY